MTSSTSNIGQVRRLQRCATPDGKLVVLAVDHRNNLRRALNPHDPEAVPDEDLVAFKREVVAALAPVSPAVLLDPEYGAQPCIESGALPGSSSLVLALERTSYSGPAHARRSELLPGWDPQRALGIGADAVKLLVYYHPRAATAPQIETLARQTAAACSEAHIPFFLEPLTYSPHPNQPKLLPEERRWTVIETARRLTSLPGVGVLKVEFPLDIKAVPDEGEWLVACRELDAASQVPWVLLSAGADFETYLLQVAVAARAGACGVAVGRAVWQEAVDLSAVERQAFLTTIARERMARVTALCRSLARPWHSKR